ncbi:MAG: hypothetical protein EPO13_10860 [Actinomycetota bacterium]|nr:MAG: hypothetical protein EPO13_10860 [Actinomycetota bacterium]
MSRSRTIALAAAWTAAGAVGATVLTGVAFAGVNAVQGNGPANGDYAAAADAAPSPDATSGPRRPGGGPGFGLPGLGGLGFLGGLAGVGFLGGLADAGQALDQVRDLAAGGLLHGDIAVADKSGTATTLRLQRGKATATSDSSITVRSTDGYESTYAITGDTTVYRDRDEVKASAITADDTVFVLGTVSGDTVTGRVVVALSPEAAAALEQRRQDFADKVDGLRDRVEKWRDHHGDEGGKAPGGKPSDVPSTAPSGTPSATGSASPSASAA